MMTMLCAEGKAMRTAAISDRQRSPLILVRIIGLSKVALP